MGKPSPALAQLTVARRLQRASVTGDDEFGGGKMQAEQTGHE